MQTIFKERSGSTTEWESGRQTSTGVEEEKEELLKQIRLLKSPRARRNNAANSSNVRRVPTVLPKAARRYKELRYFYVKIRDNVSEDKFQHVLTGGTGAASEPRRMPVSLTKPQTRRATHVPTC